MRYTNDEMREIWVTAFRNEAQALAEVERLAKAAFKCDKKNKRALSLACSIIERTVIDTVNAATQCGMLPFLGAPA